MSDAVQMFPHSIEAERGILGCALLDGSLVGDLHVELFQDLRHRIIATALLDMVAKGAPVDVLTLVPKLTAMGELERVGGLAEVTSLPFATPSHANFSHWRNILQDLAKLRKAITVASDTIAAARETGADADTVLERFEHDALAIRQTSAGSGEVDIKATLRDVISDMEEAHASGGRIRGIATGFHALDQLTGGLQPGEVFIIAARPSVGKTSLAMNIAEHVAVASKVPVGVFSMEMSAKELVRRMVCSLARVNSGDVKKGNLTASDFARMATATGKIGKAPLHIDDRGGLTVGQVGSSARRMVQRHGIKLLIVDYLGLMSGGQKRSSRYEDTTAISIGMKALAKELGIPLIVLAQLNRASEQESRAPRMSDLRDSGGVEQDADIVGLLHRDDREDGDTQTVNLIIAKQRNGAVGKIELQFHRQFTRFESTSMMSH